VRRVCRCGSRYIVFFDLSKLHKIKLRSIYPSDLQEVVVGSAHDKYEAGTINLIIFMCITMYCVEFSCFLFYVLFLFHTRKLYI